MGSSSSVQSSIFHRDLNVYTLYHFKLEGKIVNLVIATIIPICTCGTRNVKTEKNVVTARKVETSFVRVPCFGQQGKPFCGKSGEDKQTLGIKFQLLQIIALFAQSLILLKGW